MISGLFIVLPCIESYKKVDLRTITLGVPPQEVRHCLVWSHFYLAPCYLHCSFWPRTAWWCQWTPWYITACPTPSSVWQTWRTLITAQSRFFGKYLWIFNEMTIFSSIAGAMQLSPTQQLIFILSVCTRARWQYIFKQCFDIHRESSFVHDAVLESMLH